MKELLGEMKQVLEDMEVDIDKFVNGTNAAAGRARKKLQLIKKMAQELRIAIQDEKNKRAGKGGGKVMPKGKKTVKKEKPVVEEKKAGRGRPKKG